MFGVTLFKRCYLHNLYLDLGFKWFCDLAVDVSSSIADFTAVDSVVTGMEHQIEAIKLHLKEEIEALPRAQVLKCA